MNKTPSETLDFFRAFHAAYTSRDDRSVWFFPPALCFAAAREAQHGRSDIELGVQNVFWEAAGAFTGEISAPMARSAGATLVLIGHSERRHVFGETDAEVGRKAAASIEAGLHPTICVGETLAERKAERLEEVLGRQLEGALALLSAEAIAGVTLAYEPVWAIGTGVNATPADASSAHGWLRSRLRDRIGEAAARIPILYGGSVKPDNAAELLAATDVDGLLVGGASLDPASFASIASV
jgi:triosephosphate isomerase